jgi:hypothetical protein
VRLSPSRLAACASVVRPGLAVVVLVLVTCSIPSDVQDGPGVEEGPTIQRGPSFGLAASSQQVIVAAGDIAKCEKNTDEQTASVVDSVIRKFPNATVVPLGDLVYPTGTATTFKNCYTPSWGRFRNRTRAVVGSHEYDASDAATGYFDYFNGVGVSNGKAGPRGKGYYSWNPNEYWHVIVINSNSAYVPTRSGSAQDSWLAADLAANNRPCIMAMWHHPRFFSQPQGPLNGSPGYTTPLWQRLYAAGADVILNASQHQYERFARQRPDGTADPRGIRQFIVGTGGASGSFFGAIEKNSEVRGNTLGVLTITLGAGFYSWSYASTPSRPFTDKGTTSCHGSSQNPPPPPATSIVLTASGRTDGTTQYMTLDWTGARGTSVDVYRNGALISRTANDGHYVNSRAFSGPATYTYKVCETGTTVCSNQQTVVFR